MTHTPPSGSEGGAHDQSSGFDVDVVPIVDQPSSDALLWALVRGIAPFVVVGILWVVLSRFS